MQINRFPVMVLWATVVAERVGYPMDSALTLGKAASTLHARDEALDLEIFWMDNVVGGNLTAGFVRLVSQDIPIRMGKAGPIAELKGKPIDPATVRKYLDKKFGTDLAPIMEAMRKLVASYDPAELEEIALRLYMQFKPDVPFGRAGWGAKGELKVEMILQLAKEGRGWCRSEDESAQE